MSNRIAEAAAYYITVCEEHGRHFPLRNILVVTEGYKAATDKDRFVDDVREWLAADARRRFDETTTDIASEGRFGRPSAATTEFEMMEEATRLVAAALGILDRVPAADPDLGDEVDPTGGN